MHFGSPTCLSRACVLRFNLGKLLLFAIYSILSIFVAGNFTVSSTIVLGIEKILGEILVCPAPKFFLGLILSNPYH
jgi:hypothetical protein